MKWYTLFAILLVVGLFAGVINAKAGYSDPTSTTISASDDDTGNATSAKKIRNRIEEIEQTRSTVQAEYQNAVSEWTAIRNKFANASMNASGPEIESAKKYVLKLIDQMILHIEKLASKIDNSTVLSDDEKEDILVELEANIVELEQLKSEVELAETKADVKEVAQKVRDTWKESRAVLKKYTGLLLIKNFGNMLNRYEAFLEKANKRVDALEQKGYEVSALRNTISTSEQSMTSVRAELELARDSFLGISDMQDADKRFQEGHTHLVQARKLLFDEIKNLKIAFKEVMTSKTTNNESESENEGEE